MLMPVCFRACLPTLPFLHACIYAKHIIYCQIGILLQVGNIVHTYIHRHTYISTHVHTVRLQGGSIMTYTNINTYTNTHLYLPAYLLVVHTYIHIITGQDWHLDIKQVSRQCLNDGCPGVTWTWKVSGCLDSVSDTKPTGAFFSSKPSSAFIIAKHTMSMHPN